MSGPADGPSGGVSDADNNHGSGGVASRSGSSIEDHRGQESKEDDPTSNSASRLPSASIESTASADSTSNNKGGNPDGERGDEGGATPSDQSEAPRKPSAVADSPWTGSDRLGFTTYAEALAFAARTVEGPKDSLCVGLYASWGSGKTFLWCRIWAQLVSKFLVEDANIFFKRYYSYARRWADSRAYRNTKNALKNALKNSIDALNDSNAVDPSEKQKWKDMLNELNSQGEGERFHVAWGTFIHVAEKMTSSISICGYACHEYDRIDFEAESDERKELHHSRHYEQVTILAVLLSPFFFLFLIPIIRNRLCQSKRRNATDLEEGAERAEEEESAARVWDLLIGETPLGKGDIQMNTAQQRLFCGGVLRHLFLHLARFIFSLLFLVFRSAKVSWEFIRCLDDDALPNGATKYIEVQFDAWVYQGSDILWASLIKKLWDEVEAVYGTDAVRLHRWSISISGESPQDLPHMKFKKRQLALRHHKIMTIASILVGLSGAIVIFATSLFEGLVSKIPEILVKGAAQVLALVPLAIQAYAHVKRWVEFIRQSEGEKLLEEAKSFERHDFSEESGFMGKVKEEVKYLYDFLESTPYEDKEIGCLRYLRLCVFVDDLDRCNSDKIVKVLQAIILLLVDAPVTCWLAIDSRVVVASIEAEYKHVFADQNISGHEFLDKIVQMPFCLPDLEYGSKKAYLHKMISSGADGPTNMLLRRIQWLANQEQMSTVKHIEQLKEAAGGILSFQSLLNSTSILVDDDTIEIKDRHRLRQLIEESKIAKGDPSTLRPDIYDDFMFHASEAVMSLEKRPIYMLLGRIRRLANEECMSKLRSIKDLKIHAKGKESFRSLVKSVRLLVDDDTVRIKEMSRLMQLLKKAESAASWSDLRPDIYDDFMFLVSEAVLTLEKETQHQTESCVYVAETNHTEAPASNQKPTLSSSKASDQTGLSDATTKLNRNKQNRPPVGGIEISPVPPLASRDGAEQHLSDYSTWQSPDESPMLNIMEQNKLWEYAYCLNGNPRKIKRIVNIYNVCRYIAEQRHQGVELDAFNLKLLKFVVLLEQWPYRMAWVMQVIEDAQQAYYCDKEREKCRTSMLRTNVGDAGNQVFALFQDLLSSQNNRVGEDCDLITVFRNLPLDLVYKGVAQMLIYSSPDSCKHLARDSDPQMFEHLLVIEPEIMLSDMMMPCNDADEFGQPLLRQFAFNMQKSTCDTVSRQLDMVLVQSDKSGARANNDEWSVSFLRKGSLYHGSKNSNGWTNKPETSSVEADVPKDTQ